MPCSASCARVRAELCVKMSVTSAGNECESWASLTVGSQHRVGSNMVRIPGTRPHHTQSSPARAFWHSSPAQRRPTHCQIQLWKTPPSIGERHGGRMYASNGAARPWRSAAWQLQRPPCVARGFPRRPPWWRLRAAHDLHGRHPGGNGGRLSCCRSKSAACGACPIYSLPWWRSGCQPPVGRRSCQRLLCPFPEKPCRRTRLSLPRPKG